MWPSLFVPTTSTLKSAPRKLSFRYWRSLLSLNVTFLQNAYRITSVSYTHLTHSFKEYEAAFLSQPKEDQRNQLERFLSVSKDTFEKLARFQNQSPSCQEVQQIVKEWQQYISESFYKCDNQILLYLGQLYTSDERFSNYINGFSSGNLASFFSEAINIFCSKNK